MDKRKRIEWIDTAKGLCITLVVLNHILLYQGFPSLYPQSYSTCNIFLSSFRMPLYFFLSGVFFKTYGGGFNFIKKKINKILIPFIFWYMMGIIIISLFVGEGIFICYITNKYILLDFFYNDCHSTNGPIWFLLCLFEVNLLFCSIHLLIKKKTLIYIASFIIGLLGLWLSYYSINLHASLDTALTCLPFFVFGYFIKNETNILNSSFLDKHLLLYAILCGAICFFIADEVEFYRNIYSYHSYFTLYICGFLGTIMIILIAKCIGTIPILTYYGRYSIIILCTHYLLYTGLNHYLFHYFEDGLFKFLCIFIIIMLFELVCIPILKRFLPYATAQKELL